MILTVQSFSQLQSVNPGFDGRNVLSLQLALPPAKYAKSLDILTFADKLHAEFTGLFGVRDAAAISLMPLTGLLSTQDYRVVGQPAPPPNEVPQAHYRIVTPGYFLIMGIGLSGREFNDDDRESTRRVAIISRAFAERHWPDGSPIGEHIVVGTDSLEVVGVSDDVKQFGLDAGRTADLYVPLRQMAAGQAQFVAARMYWVVQTNGDPMKKADAVWAAVRLVDKDVATSSIRPVSLLVATSIGARRFNADLIKVAGAASFLLALIGVYSVTAFSVSRRTREIGIRLTLGATSIQVIRVVVIAEWIAIAVGMALGTAGAVLVTRVLSSVLYGSTGVEPVVIAAAAATFGMAAAAASYLPARRVMRADPMASLRSE
jgi:putative ABC transport system permease protein